MPSRPPVAFHLVRALPKRAITRAAGAIASTRLPAALRGALYRGYAGAVGADLEECGGDVSEFPTFNDFFARPLREGVRAWATEATLASPCDGRVDACGVVREGTMVQAKGIDYAVADLVCDPAAEEAFEGGAYATVYLSPADYHRVHAPADLVIEQVRYQPGELWPVNGLSVPWVDGLFRRNERVVFRGRLGGGARIALVMVGATVVGRIRVAHPDVPTPRVPDPVEIDLSSPWRLRRGDELGAFLLGSTVVVVVDASAGALASAVPHGSPIRLGEPLLTRADAPT